MAKVDELLKNKELFNMLEFETQMFLDLIHNDGLVVAAKGLNLDVVIRNVLKVYCDPGNLVLVLNCSSKEEKYFIEKLNDADVHSTMCDINVEDRKDLYLSGGVHFVTTRILVVDMLKNRLPIDKITGIVVLKAHTVLESCQEAFTLRLFRQKNKTGFIKAFSNSVQSFTMGFGHVERVMRALFVKELFIWPRFHSTVVQSLKDRQPNVIELHVPISETTSKIQTCILDLMNLTVKELKRINKTLELQEITVDNCLTKQFHKILELQLDCIWHQLSSKSKQLIADLKTLRHLILTMLYADPVTFYTLICSYRKMKYAQTSMWVLMEPAELLFSYASSLVFTGDKELNPEFCPKWNALLEILKIEIPTEIRKNKKQDTTILILCQDFKTCYQLNQLLTDGPKRYLFKMALQKGVAFKSINERFKNCQNLPEFSQARESAHSNEPVENAKFSKKIKIGSEIVAPSSSSENHNDSKEADEAEDLKDSYCLTMSQSVFNNESVDDSNHENDENLFEPFTEMENMDLTQLCEATKATNTPTVLIRAFRTTENSLDLGIALEDVKPNFIIMYHSNISAIRNLELYEARRPKDVPLKVYFLIHTETVEEQSYLTTLRREKEAFEFLIQTKSTMVIPADQDGKSDDCTALQRESNIPETSSRHGGRVDPERHSIIVDMREFRSELPALIHKRGIEVEPMTITIGDYILTPEICVERKSISDLIGSLNSGRLYQQCTRMSRFYSKPMLLIEFDHNKPFSWQSHYMISKDSDSFDIQQKLLLLTMHFPKLKLVWSPSPYATAQLFEELKAGKEQPNIQYASSLSDEPDVDIIETKYNSSIYDFVQKMPGINSKNIDVFLKKIENLSEVIKLSEDELNGILSNSKDTKALYSIIHEQHTPKEGSEQVKHKGKPREKFKHFRK